MEWWVGWLDSWCCFVFLLACFTWFAGPGPGCPGCCWLPWLLGCPGGLRHGVMGWLVGLIAAWLVAWLFGWLALVGWLVGW